MLLLVARDRHRRRAASLEPSRPPPAARIVAPGPPLSSRPHSPSPPPASVIGGLPPPMSTPGSRARAAGRIALLLAVGAGVASGDPAALVLCFAGVVAGASLVAVGVRMADDPATVAPPPVFSAMVARARALAAAFPRRGDLAVAGILLASSAVTAAAGEEGPVLCFGALALLLLGLSLVNIRFVAGE